MHKETLEKLYAAHRGKVSDKWSSYLTQYDRVLGAYRPHQIRLLEIGIQNGGSLEIWSKYFPFAERIIGCDVNPDCARLKYEDPRIAVVIGDANTDAVQAQIISMVPAFDIIIDDASHRSSAIVKSFAKYFPHLREGGLFIAEDLHCSYWDELEGGLFHPLSAVTFFKHLVDVMNHEHWGLEKGRSAILNGFRKMHAVDLDEATLQQIHSLQFSNSMCVVRKDTVNRNTLGVRVVAGAEEVVSPGYRQLDGIPNTPRDQTSNEWANDVSAREELAILKKELTQQRSTSDEQIRALRGEIASRDSRINSMLASTSWRITAPLRFLRRLLMKKSNS